MNPALITYYDMRQWQIASCSYTTANNFASLAGLDVVAEPSGAIISGAFKLGKSGSGLIAKFYTSGGINTGSYDRWAYMKKIELCIRELGSGRPYVVWADCDVVFNVDADTTVLSLYTASFNAISNNYVVPETSFFIAYPEAIPFLEAWSASYTAYVNTNSYVNYVNTDELSLIPLFMRNRFTQSLIPSLALIPAYPYMASTVNGMGTGSIGKHFYVTLMSPIVNQPITCSLGMITGSSGLPTGSLENVSYATTINFSASLLAMEQYKALKFG